MLKYALKQVKLKHSDWCEMWTSVLCRLTLDLSVFDQLTVVDLSCFFQTLLHQFLHLLRRNRSSNVLHQNLKNTYYLSCKDFTNTEKHPTGSLSKCVIDSIFKCVSVPVPARRALPSGPHLVVQRESSTCRCRTWAASHLETISGTTAWK